MRKIIFTAAMAFVLGVNAQVKFNIGVKAGANYSSLTDASSATQIVGSLLGGNFTSIQNQLTTSLGSIGDSKLSFTDFIKGSAFKSLGNIEGLSGRTSFHVGLAMELKFLKKFAIESEILFSAQGGKKVKKEEKGGEEITSIFRQNYNYLNFPVVFKYYPIGGLNIQFGPQLGVLLSKSTKLEVGKTKVDLTENESIKEKAKNFFDGVDFGLAFGLGYQLKNGMHVDARYILGLTGVQDSKELSKVTTNTTEDNIPSTRNGVFQISLGYYFL